jgi:hypothetical protein
MGDEDKKELSDQPTLVAQASPQASEKTPPLCYRDIKQPSRTIPNAMVTLKQQPIFSQETCDATPGGAAPPAATAKPSAPPPALPPVPPPVTAPPPPSSRAAAPKAAASAVASKLTDEQLAQFMLGDPKDVGTVRIAPGGHSFQVDNASRTRSHKAYIEHRQWRNGATGEGTGGFTFSAHVDLQILGINDTGDYNVYSKARNYLKAQKFVLGNRLSIAGGNDGGIPFDILQDGNIQYLSDETYIVGYGYEKKYKTIAAEDHKKMKEFADKLVPAAIVAMGASVDAKEYPLFAQEYAELRAKAVKDAAAACAVPDPKGTKPAFCP